METGAEKTGSYGIDEYQPPFEGENNGGVVGDARSKNLISYICIGYIVMSSSWTIFCFITVLRVVGSGCSLVL